MYVHKINVNISTSCLIIEPNKKEVRGSQWNLLRSSSPMHQRASQPSSKSGWWFQPHAQILLPFVAGYIPYSILCPPELHDTPCISSWIWASQNCLAPGHQLFIEDLLELYRKTVAQGSGASGHQDLDPKGELIRSTHFSIHLWFLGGV